MSSGPEASKSSHRIHPQRNMFIKFNLLHYLPLQAALLQGKHAFF